MQFSEKKNFAKKIAKYEKNSLNLAYFRETFRLVETQSF